MNVGNLGFALPHHVRDHVCHLLVGLSAAVGAPHRDDDAIIHADDVERGKPDPEVFFKVADLLGVAYTDCLVFEDSPTGAKAAGNAGMKALILTTTHRAEEFAEIGSVVRCMADYTEVDILTELENLNKT